MSQTDFDAFLKRIDAIVKNQIIPLEPLLLTQQWEQLYTKMDAIRHEVKKQKLWAPNLPASVGGMNLTTEELGKIAEVSGQSPLGHYCFGCQAPDAGNAELLHLYANDFIKENFLLPLANGDIRSCFAMTEPDTAGSNPTMLDATAELVDGHWVINGRKWFTTAADGSQFTIVMAVTEPDAPKHLRASMIIVPLDNPGYHNIRNIPVMGHEGSGYYSHSEVEFTNCRVPANHLIGERGQGFKMAQQRLGPGRIQHCMRWLGIARRCFEIMCKHVKQRQITPQATLADQPVIQTKIAESFAAMNASRALVLETAKIIDDEGWSAAKHHISMIKFECANMLQLVTDNTLQSMGALGMTDDSIVAFFYREERAARIYDGPDEVHKISLAKSLLKQF
ncbi:acyl-CoA dehydrogenase family protein [Marinicella sp. S1101]|uniref:acyl-CoA dehydrogenase family protein n=1 Tax=Marinicella marina TaxID=2996016 RepID=UPI002260ED03|nr:acyl-CoA dehydrogenase family protein [Marinicella marina]MCX7554740.1 acyl-CoA dehydrogenase family protein [Marinicella marina]MDJ1141444.1 acyl-CoA dehydrogenase family protein [Marinicella marina]